MKNWIKGLAAGILVLGLSACSTTAETKTDPDTGKKVEINKKSKMTAQEVYEKSMAVLKNKRVCMQKWILISLLKYQAKSLK